MAESDRVPVPGVLVENMDEWMDECVKCCKTGNIAKVCRKWQSSMAR